MLNRISDLERGLYPLHPRRDRWIVSKVKAPLVSEARVSDQRNIGEGDRLPHQERRSRQAVLQALQGAIAPLDQPRLQLAHRLAGVADLEPGDGDIGLVAVLLPEHPFQHPRTVICVGGDEI